jgi:hypothetical protein
MIEVGTRVEIVGGEYWPRTGVVAGHKTVQGMPCVSVSLDRPLANRERVIVVLEEHVLEAE